MTLTRIRPFFVRAMIAVCWWLLVVWELQSQPLTFRRIGTEQGLSQCTVLSMLQDRYGFMWFCAQDGLNRYDGYSFKVYKHNAEDSASLSSSLTITVFEDRAGVLWVGTYNGLNRFDRKTGTFKRYYPDSSRTPQRCSIWSISELSDGTIVVGTGSGLFQLDKKQTTMVEYQTADKSNLIFKNKLCQRIAEKAGRFLVRVERRLFELDTLRNTFFPVLFTPESINPYRQMLTPVFVDIEGAYWSVTDANADSSLIGLYRYKPRTKTNRQEEWTRYHPFTSTTQAATDRLGKLYQDRRQQIWVQTLNGLNLFDPVNNKFVQFQHNPSDPLSLGANRIVSMYEDRSGLLWIASNGSGLNVLLPQKFSLYRLADAPATKEQGRFHFVKGVVEDQSGNIWIAEYDHGLRKFDRKTGAFIEYKDKQPGKQNGLTSILCLHPDKDGNIWFGGSFNRLGKFVPKTGKFYYYHNTMFPATEESNDILWLSYMRFLAEDERGFLWLATDKRGLQVFSKKQERFIGHFLGSLDVSSVFVARTGKIYVGTDGAGIYVFTPRHGTENADGLPEFFIRHYSHNPSDPKSLSANNTIKYFYEDPQGLLWIATDGGGLNCMDPVTGQFTRFTERNGLPNNVVYGILPDVKGNLWLSTNKGISRFSPKTETFRNYDVSDGLQANEFNTNAFCRLKSGELLFSGIGGINIFHPEKALDNPNIPPVRLTELLINDKVTPLPGILEELQTLTLNHDENTLSFTFAALDYTNPAKNQYVYKLEGIDRDWVQSGTIRTVRYAALPVGDYTFRVKACNNDGVWNIEGVTLKIVLVPPFWKTLWFYGLCIVVSVGGVAGFARFIARRRLLQRIERMEHERALERERLEKALAIEQERGRISQDIHDEVGPGMTKILLLSGFADLMPQTTNSGAANGNTDLSRTVQEVIESMAGIIWMTKPENDTLDNLIAYIREYAFNYMQKTTIRCIVDIPDVVPELSINGTLRRNIFLTVKEALNNIVKHSQATQVLLSLVIPSELRVSLFITDNGKGFNMRQVSRFSNGLDNMYKRMKECGCLLHLKSIEGQGTELHLEIMLPPTPLKSVPRLVGLQPEQ